MGVTVEEMRLALGPGASDAIDNIIFFGSYPCILDQGLNPRQALGDYLETRVERDVRCFGEFEWLGVRALTSSRRLRPLSTT